MGHVESMSATRLGSGHPLVFVMGWGNRLDGANERWFLDRLAARCEVHAVELPTNPTDFTADYLEPLRDRLEAWGFDDPPFLSHSTGGLVVAHLEPSQAVHISPWWAFHGEKHRERVLDLGSKLPIERPIVPIDFGRAEVGARLGDEAWSRLPKRVSPVFVREIRDAQSDLPPATPGEHVCCSLSDTVVGLHGIGDRVPPARVHLFDGGHEPFSSADREAACAVVEDALATTTDVLDNV